MLIGCVDRMCCEGVLIGCVDRVFDIMHRYVDRCVDRMCRQDSE